MKKYNRQIMPPTGTPARAYSQIRKILLSIRKKKYPESKAVIAAALPNMENESSILCFPERG